MKRIIFITGIILTGVCISLSANAQLWKRISHEVRNRAENHVVKDAGNATDKAIDKTEDAAVNSINNSNTDSVQTSHQQPSPAPVISSAQTLATPSSPISETVSYKNYDFVPGDKIIFETDLTNQKDAELPARIGILRGNAEIQTYNGEKVIHLDKGNAIKLIPQIDSANYLPDQFTVEFDLLYNTKDPQAYNTIKVNFYKADKTNDYITNNEGNYYFDIYEADEINWGKNITHRSLQPALINALKIPHTWRHIAIYVNKNIGKVYIDQYRVGASNTLPKGITKLSIGTNGRVDYLIKNLRIAGGGSDAYHKITTEGKLVTHGIHFASGQADMLPESMGTINEIYAILKNHRELKFEIDGYTDNTGNAEDNLKLSQKRSDAVKVQLIKMGIDTSRLTTKGFGAGNPIDSNTTPEGKANNRRVEFVKK